MITLLVVFLIFLFLYVLSDPNGRKIVKNRVLFLNINQLVAIYLRKYANEWYIVGMFKDGEHLSLSSGYENVSHALAKMREFKTNHTGIITAIDHRGVIDAS